MRIFIIKIKSILIPIVICMFIIFLLLFSKNNISAAKTGLYLWANSVVPSLLPFFIATELLCHTNTIYILGKHLSPVMKPIFNVPGEGSFALLMGIISGYPIGAKIVTNLKLKGILNDVEAERLLAFTNNSGPLFIIGTVGTGLFLNSIIGLKLLITHILACLSTGFIFRWWKKSKEKNCRQSINLNTSTTLDLNNLGKILSESIINSINTLFMIGGFIVLFSIIISMLYTSHLLIVLSNFLMFLGITPSFSCSILIGLIEVTNGISCICLQNISLNSQIIMCAFILGFGGFSVLLQVLSIISRANISIKPYIIGKFLQACFAAIYISLII